jgi:hypothetical protein
VDEGGSGRWPCAAGLGSFVPSSLYRGEEQATLAIQALDFGDYALSISSLFRGEEQATLAIQALDFGDYALSISLFKRALRDLNQSFSLLSEKKFDENKFVVSARDDYFPKLFDLREIWLRVMNECREELERPSDEDED